jgi:ferredoxin
VRGGHDAVLIAVGRVNEDEAERFGLAFADGRLRIDRTTHQTESTGIFGAGDAVRSRSMPDVGQQVVYAATNGKAAATCLDQYLRKARITGHPKLAALRTGRPTKEELVAMAAEAGAGPAICRGTESVSRLTDEQARAEARRCLHCDCAKLDGCQLRKYAEMYGADGSRYRGARRRFERVSGHPEIVHQPGKCILCGLCVQIAEQAGERLGLTFVGRGFDVRVAPPFDESLAKALTVSARQCAEACPTGALTLRKEHPCDAALRHSR